MIIPLLYLWLSTVYVAAVFTPVLLWNNHHRDEADAGDEEYVGRHRTDLQPTPAFDWQADFEARIAANLAERKARKAALKGPTQELPVAPVDSRVGPYVHSAGAGRYAHLRQAEMDARADLAARRHKLRPVAWDDELVGAAT